MESLSLKQGFFFFLYLYAITGKLYKKWGKLTKVIQLFMIVKFISDDHNPFQKLCLYLFQ